MWNYEQFLLINKSVLFQEKKKPCCKSEATTPESNMSSVDSLIKEKKIAIVQQIHHKEDTITKEKELSITDLVIDVVKEQLNQDGNGHLDSSTSVSDKS